MSLHKIVQGESAFFVKKYSIVKSQFGDNLQLYIFKNCSGVPILSAIRFAKQVILQFEKDLQKNNFIELQKTILPDIENIMIYGGKNQAYIGFTSVVYCQNIDKAIEQFEKNGYGAFVNKKDFFK